MKIIKKEHVSVIIVVFGFLQIFVNSFYNIGMGAYGAAICFITSLYLKNNFTPILFCIMGFLSCVLFILSPSPIVIAALFPLVGFLFSGEDRYSELNNKPIRYLLWVSVLYFYFVVSFSSESNSSVASHNQLSALIALAFIIELLYFRNISILYAPLIIYSFIYFGNRSAIFLLAVYIKNKIALILFIIAGLYLTLIANEFIEVPGFLEFLFGEGGILFRSFKETRGDYLGEFLSKFNIFGLKYDGWGFSDIPETKEGIYDLHNSFLTVIVRDSYLGILKVILWSVQFFIVPLGFFVSLTLRAAHDSFLLGGVIDIVVFALIGRNLINLAKLIKIKIGGLIK